MEDSIPSFPHLADDIIFEILYRLPVKTLVRFYCVCKLWRKLITTDRVFILSQLQNNVNNISGGYDNLLGGDSRENSTGQENLDLQVEIFTEKLIHASENSPAYRQIFREGKFKIIGCCDGMICFVKACLSCFHPDSRFMIYLCNPALHQYRALPPGNYQIRSCSHNVIVSFFFDTVIDDYKVVKIMYRYASFLVDIYSLSTNSWKVLSLEIVTPHSRATFKRPVVHNGFPYWFSCSSSDWTNVRADWTYVLNELDTVQGKIHEISFPERLQHPHLELVQGSLWIFDSVSINQNEVWIKQEGKTGSISWTKQLVIPEISFVYPLSNRTTGVTASGKHLISCPLGTMVLYDPKDQTIEERIEGRLDGRPFEYVVVDYVASLISVIPPPADDKKFSHRQILSGVENKDKSKGTTRYSTGWNFLSSICNCLGFTKN